MLIQVATVVPEPLRYRTGIVEASACSGRGRAVAYSVDRIPAELRASTTFSLAWAGNLTPYLAGVKLAGWIALVLPTVGGLFVWHAILFGARLAALHLGVGVVVSALLMERYSCAIDLYSL